MDWSFLFFLGSVLFGLGLGAGVFSGAQAAIYDEERFGGWKLWVSALIFTVLQFGMTLAGYGIARSLAGNSDMEGAIVWAAILLALYFAGKMILEAIRGQRRGAAALEKELRAAEKTVGGRTPITAEEAVPGREVTRVRVSERIPVLWKVFLKAFSASGAAFAAGFSIPKLPFIGALAEAGIICAICFILALSGLFGDPKKKAGAARYALIPGAVLVIAAAFLSLFRL